MKVVGLAIYPIKSARRIEVESAVVRERGFDGDRRWMLVDEDGLFVTQRKVPELAEIVVEDATESAPELTFRGDSLVVAGPTRETMTVEVWGDSVEALDAGEAASSWLTERLGTRLNLVWMGPGSRREVEGVSVSFADGYPYLLTTRASLDAVVEAVGHPIEMQRFRPNVILDGNEPFDEHSWAQVRIGEALFELVKPCARCTVTTIDQDRGVKTGNEPLASLARINKIDGAAVFGENLIARTEGATIHVGDEVEVLQLR